MTESFNYTPAALLKWWPHHFTPAQAMTYGRTAYHLANQKMIGELAYGGRMGNAPAFGFVVIDAAGGIRSVLQDVSDGVESMNLYRM